jgi:ABC-2 type transport system ATP-binding protein
MIEIKNLSKSYGKTKVLTDINLTLEENKIYGLLGRNGVGKTTLINLISNQIKADTGKILIDDEEIFENSKAMENVCLVKEKGIPVDNDRVKRIFRIASILYKDWDEDYKDFLVREFKVDVNKRYNKLSRGNQTLVGLIIGLASRSKLTIFDEPSLGLDAAVRYKFYNILLEDVQSNPRTIIISTHLIDEVTNLFEEVIILKDEKVFLKDEVTKLLEKGYFLNGKEDKILPIVKNKNIIHKEQFGSSIIIGLYDTLSQEEKQLLKKNNVEISSIPLQKLFVYLTENSVKEGN